MFPFGNIAFPKVFSNDVKPSNKGIKILIVT